MHTNKRSTCNHNFKKKLNACTKIGNNSGINQLTHNWLLIDINYNLKVVYITRASAWKKWNNQQILFVSKLMTDVERIITCRIDRETGVREITYLTKKSI